MTLFGLWVALSSACIGTDDDLAVGSVESPFTTSTRCNSRADCPAIANSTATCSNRRCSYACNTNFKECGAACIPSAGCCSNPECVGSDVACNGTCGANHVCSFPTASCGGATCSSPNIVDTGTCMAGACRLPAPRACANNFICPVGGTACKTSCASSADCAAGFVCAGTSCVARCTSAASCPAAPACHVAVCFTTTGLCSTANAPDNSSCGAKLGLCSAGTCNIPIFSTLGPNTAALAVSGDGSVVIGVGPSPFGSSPFSWTRATGSVGLTMPQGSHQCLADAISADGVIAAGYCDSLPVIWSGTSPSVLGLASGTITGNLAAANADGSILTGVLTSNDGTSGHSGLWAGITPTFLAEPAGAMGSTGVGISSDGSVIVGNVYGIGDVAGLGRAYRWTRATGVMALVPLIPGTPSFSQALGVSADGNKVLFFSKGFGSAVWTASTSTLTLLGANFTPRAISGDGNTVVGHTSGPVIWTGGTPVSLTTTLANLGVNLGDFNANTFSAVSTNGKVLVGTGSSISTGVQQGWVAVLP